MGFSVYLAHGIVHRGALCYSSIVSSVCVRNGAPQVKEPQKKQCTSTVECVGFERFPNGRGVARCRLAGGS